MMHLELPGSDADDEDLDAAGEEMSRVARLMGVSVDDGGMALASIGTIW